MLDPGFPTWGCTNFLFGNIFVENCIKTKLFGPREGRPWLLSTQGSATDNYGTISETKTVHTFKFLQFEHTFNPLSSTQFTLLGRSQNLSYTHVSVWYLRYVMHARRPDTSTATYLVNMTTHITVSVHRVNTLFTFNIRGFFWHEIVNNMIALFVSLTKKAIDDACVYWRSFATLDVSTISVRFRFR